MSASTLRTRAAAHDDVADKLAEMVCALTGKLQHLRKVGAWETAREVEIELRAAITAEEHALDRALSCRVEAANLEYSAARTSAMAAVAA
jgi:hypothetical protein